MEEVTYENIRFLMWDIGGQESSRTAWSTYYQNTQVIILVIDSTDRERLGIVNTELGKILTHEVCLFFLIKVKIIHFILI